MNDVLTGLIVAAVVLAGWCAGMAIDRLVVQYPARHKIGALAYVEYAKVTDLANGVAFYAIIAIGGALLDIAALVVAISDNAGDGLTWALALATASGLGVLLATSQAAPTLLRAGRKTEPREEAVAPLLERFIRIAYVRAMLLLAQFGFLIWATLKV